MRPSVVLRTSTSQDTMVGVLLSAGNRVGAAVPCAMGPAQPATGPAARLWWCGGWGLPAARGVEDCDSQRIGVTQRDEVPAGNHRRFDTEPFAG
jgi:hypothetical protein